MQQLYVQYLNPLAESQKLVHLPKSKAWKNLHKLCQCFAWIISFGDISHETIINWAKKIKRWREKILENALHIKSTYLQFMTTKVPNKYPLELFIFFWQVSSFPLCPGPKEGERLSLGLFPCLCTNSSTT